MSTYLNGVPTDATGRCSSFVLAASDSSQLNKAQADYVCNAADDFPSINAAIALMTAMQGHLKLLPGNYYGNTEITIDVSRMTFDFEGANLVYSGTGKCLSINNGALAYNFDSNVVKGGAIIATGAALASATATALHLRGVINAWIRTGIHNFKAGVAVELETNDAAGDYCESTQWWLNIRDCKTGVKLTGDTSFSYQHFRKFTYVVSDEAMANCIAIDAENNTYPAVGWVFDEFYLWPYSHNAISGIKGINLYDCQIEYALVDSLAGTHGDAFILLDGTDPRIVIDRVDIFNLNAAGRAPLAWQTKHYDFETRVPTLGWATDDTTVGNSAAGPMAQTVHTTVAANERGLLNTPVAFMDEGVAYTSINWDKAKAFIFDIMVGGSDVQALRRFQVKPGVAEGILAAMGLAIEIQNLALFGECYGAGRATLDLSTVLSQWLTYQIMIVHFPGSRVEWYVNKVLKGTYDTPANIPNGTVASNSLVHSIINGAAGGVDAMLLLGNLRIKSKG